MPTRYFLRCLGFPELRGPGGEPVRFRTRKHLALLIYLAVEPRLPHRRDRLADLLWPDASPAEGRHSLATALSILRGRLGPRTFETSRDAVRLVAPELEVDLDRLARNEILGDEVTPPLDVGGFLDDFEVTRAPEFMLWRDLRRAQWFPAIRQAFVILMDRCRRTGDFTRIEPLADRLLRLDELSEDAIRAKMEGRAFAGDRVSAIRIFQQWRQQLADELGATPSPLVEGIALRLRRRSYEPPGSAHIPTVPTDQWRDRAFVGRGQQYRVVYERWEQTARAEGRHALVLGDLGVGKTTLVERLVTAAGLEGAVSSRVQCYEVEREIPYAAIGTLVRGLLERPGATATPPEWLAELARVIPAVAQRFPHLPPARDSEGETARLRLTEGVHQLATAVADEHPLILVVDDVHLADDASVAVLHLLMRRTQEQRIMVVLTAREADLARSPHAGRLMEVRPALALEAVALPPLTDDEIGEVLNALAAPHGLALPPAVRRALLRASAGIPLVAELLFDDWRHQGEQCLALAVGAMTVDTRGGVGDEVFRQVLDRVIQGLSEPARAVLNLAAILGERLNDLTMYQLVDLTLAQTLAGMSELTALRVLRDGGRKLEFRNELLRAHAYLQVPSPLRRALHGLIADRLLAAEAAGEQVPGLTLAWHCYRAARVPQAEPFLLRGSREAIDRGASFEAELALSSALPGLAGDDREARLLLCEALQDQGRWAESLTCLGDDEGGWARVQDTMRGALILNARGALSDTTAEHRVLLDMALSAMETNAPSEAILPAVQAASRLAYYLGGSEGTERFLHTAVARAKGATSLSTKVILSNALVAVAWSAKSLSDYQVFVSSLDDLSLLCQEQGVESAARFDLENVRGCVASSRGGYAKALDAYKTAFGIAQRIGDDGRSMIAASNIAMCLGRLGEYGEQHGWAERALRIAPRSLPPWRLVRARLHSAWSSAMSGEIRRALAGLPNDLDEVADPPAWTVQANAFVQADVLELCGEGQKALKLAQRAIQASGMLPLSGECPGTIVRWIAKTSNASPGEGKLQEALHGLMAGIDTWDLIDQVEALAAFAWFQGLRGCRSAELLDRLSEGLGRLPGPVFEQLRRLGTLPS